MASPAEIAKTLPDTLPADFGDWDTPLPDAGEQTAVSESQAAADATDSSAPSDAAVADRSISKPAIPFAEHPRAFAAAVNAPPYQSSHSSPVAGASNAYLRRLRTMKAATEHIVATHKAVEEDVLPRIVAVQEPVAEEPVAAEPDDSQIRAIFRESALTEKEEHTAGAKWKLIFAVASGLTLLVAFQIFHSGTASKVGVMIDKQPIAAKVQTAFESMTKQPAANTHPGSALPKPSATISASPVNNHQASSGQTSTTPDQTQAQMMHDQLLAPTRIPQSVRDHHPSDAPPASGVAGIEALNNNAAMNNVFSGQARPNVKAAAQKPLSISSGVATGMLIRQTAPVYPPIAKTARISGTVVIQALITKTGGIANLRVLSGPSMLQQAALDAVRTWQFRPYKLNNEPTDVETTFNVIFRLGN